jgi:hypothetical protein
LIAFTFERGMFLFFLNHPASEPVFTELGTSKSIDSIFSS